MGLPCRVRVNYRGYAVAVHRRLTSKYLWNNVLCTNFVNTSATLWVPGHQYGRTCLASCMSLIRSSLRQICLVLRGGEAAYVQMVRLLMRRH